MENLSNKHFLEWNESYKLELYDILRNLFQKTFRISKDEITDIIVTGSRVYKLPTNVFSNTSDLDIEIILPKDTFNRYFIPIDETMKSKIYLDKLQKEFPDKFRPKIKGFNFYNVHTSIFIFPFKDDGSGKHDMWFLDKYQLPYYSYKYNQYFERNIRDLIDYEIHVKNKIEPYTFCYICCNFKESPFILSLKLTDNFGIRKKQRNKFSKLFQVYICKECFDKCLTNGFQSLLEILEDYKPNY